MRKTAFGLAILLAATSISPALAADKNKATNPNEAGLRLMRESVVIFLPTALLPVYLKMKEDNDAKKK